MGVSGNEYLTSNTNVAFPFRDGQDVPGPVLRLFVDACVASGSWDVELTDASYDGFSSLSFSVGGETYSVSTGSWSSGSAYRRVDGTGASFVLDSWRLQSEAPFEYTGLHILLEPSCVMVDPGSVTSITIYEEEGGVFTERTVAGDVVLKAGYNTELSADGDGISIEAGPGLGLGTVPCDDDCADDVDTDGHPLPSDDGHVVIAGDDCYEVVVRGLKESGQDGSDEGSEDDSDEEDPGEGEEQQGEDLGYSTTFNTIQLVGKCVACCQCQQFVDVIGVLKEVAQRVADNRDAITGAMTDKYNDLVGDLDKKISGPEVDIQLDISPDSALLEYATARQDGDTDVKLPTIRNVIYVRVTCVITNLSGVPCAIGVPEGGKGNGLSVSMGSTELSNATSKKGDAGGWLVYSKIRGTQYRKDGDEDGETNFKYDDIGTLGTATWSDGDATDAWTALSLKAISDLSAGMNKSSMAEQTKDMRQSRQYTHGSGYMMAPGYSFTITNVYGVSADDLPSSKKITASFDCSLFAPMLLYAKAYNTAIPATTIDDAPDGGHVTRTTWSVPEEGVDAAATSMSTVSTRMEYNFGSNKYHGE